MTDSQVQYVKLKKGLHIKVFWMSVEGVVGTGKTELLKIIIDQLVSIHGDQLVLCVPENIEELQERGTPFVSPPPQDLTPCVYFKGIFQRCNSDPKKHAFHFQCMFFHTRTRMFQKLWRERVALLKERCNSVDLSGKTLYIVSERSIISDCIFAHVNHERGNLNDDEIVSYLSLNAMWKEMYPIHPSLFLYCKTGYNREESINICDARIDERGRPSEKELVTPEYNGCVYDAHEDVFSEGTCFIDMGDDKVYHVPVTQFCTKANYRDDDRIALKSSTDIWERILDFSNPISISNAVAN